MFISFVFAEIFLRLFICLLCAVPWNAHNAPSSRVSLYHCIWNLKSNRHLTPPSLRLLRPQWAINMPALLVLPHMAHQGYSMLTWVCKLCIFYLNNVDLYKSSEGPKHSIQPKKLSSGFTCSSASDPCPILTWTLDNKWPSPSWHKRWELKGKVVTWHQSL